MTLSLPVQEIGKCQLQKGSRAKERENNDRIGGKVKHTVQCPVCRRHDFGIQDLNWSNIFDFSFIYVKIIVEAMIS